RTQKTQKTGKEKSKNDHASAVRVQKLLNRPFFTRGQTVYYVTLAEIVSPIIYQDVPSSTVESGYGCRLTWF
ncbi:MAG TPA: hypothetical protein VF677_00005, partial [Flavobacterium sp.]